MIRHELHKRAAENNPIRIGASAVDWMGSGFVRAMSYKLASTAQSGDAAATQALADALNKRLKKISDISNFPLSDSSAAARDFREVQQDWQQHMRPLLEAVATGLGHNSAKAGTKADRYDAGEHMTPSVVLLADDVAQCMASLQLPQARGNEQTDQDVLSRIGQTYAEKEPAALETLADKATRKRRAHIGGRKTAEDHRQRKHAAGQ